MGTETSGNESEGERNETMKVFGGFVSFPFLLFPRAFLFGAFLVGFGFFRGPFRATDFLLRKLARFDRVLDWGLFYTRIIGLSKSSAKRLRNGLFLSPALS